MRGNIMQQPLLISSLLKHAERCHGDVAIVSRRVEPASGDARFHRYDWRALAARTRQLTNALAGLGVQRDDRVGTLAWNGYRHVELYYAVAGSGSIVHTINPRLFLEHIAWIINHAEDRVIFFDLDLAPLVSQLLPLCGGVRHWVLMSDEQTQPSVDIPHLLRYETLLQAERAQYDWPALDEDQAASLCYTSGTTGHPKGALYSHRSIVLQSYATAMPDVLGLSSRDVALPIVPMFHVNAWNLPYTAALVGFRLVLPGAQMDGASLSELFTREAVTFSAGVPTVWLALLKHAREHALKFPALRRCLVGGSALPRSLMEAFEAELGVRLQPSWGMTEMSPLGAVNSLKPKHDALPPAQRQRVELKAGRTPFGVAAKIIDDDGQELPRDGVTTGALMVQGPWIIDRYFKGETSPLVDGWLPTGDIATLDEDGFIDITDRAKDLIKSGGEWISSIELENIAMSHPAVAEAAVIAVAHPKWDERPLLVVVLRPGAQTRREQLLAHYAGRIAKWWVPDDVAFVAELPHTATGKLQKLKLREQFAAHRLPGVEYPA